jgi:S-adenosylmethionine:tRNA ribosyltransferase-isomerase
MRGGGKAEFLLTHRVQEGIWQCLAKPGKRLRVGDLVTGSDGLEVEISAVVDERGGRLINLTGDGKRAGTDALLERIGQTPLPPYIHADDPNRYKQRYQTVYAENDGSVAAPTAGLHFTNELLGRLKEIGVDTAKVTLHVGIGTFRPIESERIDQHTMHEESGFISEETSEKIRGARGRIVAVGTTSVRALESVSDSPRQVRAGAFATKLFAMPGFKFRTVDSMITNFHMPRSTLLVLVSAFAGKDSILNAYAHAIEKGYRFLSFGDSMMISG